MRSVIEGKLGSLEAVKEYHDCLQKDGITPKWIWKKIKK